MRTLLLLLNLLLLISASAQTLIGPRPLAPVAYTNVTTALSTNVVEIDTNACAVIGGYNAITVSNYPTLTAPGWSLASSTTAGGYIVGTWTNGSGSSFTSATEYQAPYLSTNYEVLNFVGFHADTLPNAVWTNFIAITNAGNTHTQIWTTRSHPAGWPNVPPILVWRTNSLIYGQPRWTALSQCNEIEGFHGMVPMTAITRRHVYFRGHGTGSAGDDIKTNWHGKRVWFCDTNSQVVQMTLSNAITRLQYATNVGQEYMDYSVAVLTEDIPATVEIMSMGYYRAYKTGETTWTNEGAYSTKWPTYNCYAVMGYTLYGTMPSPYLAYNSTGDLFSGVQGYIGAWRGGDSGGAFLLPMPDGLVMMFGATTSGANEYMQADLDTLTTSIGLTTNNYQITYYDFSAYPDL